MGGKMLLRTADYALFSALLAVLAILIYSSAAANLQNDSIDYYSIVQRLAEPDARPIVSNLHFTAQRFPGYGIAALVPYYAATFLIEPFVREEQITDIGQGFQSAIPSRPFPVKELFFKNIFLPQSGAVLEWKILFALLFTSYALLFAGIFLISKTLLLEKRLAAGFSLITLTIFTSPVFVQNIVSTPMYATLAAFGFSALFSYFFVKSFTGKNAKNEFLAGLALGFLALARFEGFVFFGVSAVFLKFFGENGGFLKNLSSGFVLAAAVFPAYNLLMFGNPLHFGFLANDINTFQLDLGYAFRALFHPDSGIIFFSPLIAAGIIGLMLSRQKRHLRILGFCSLALVFLMLFRVPAMYDCAGTEALEIGGINVGCPATEAEKSMLVRSDANRYVAVLAPFSVLGLVELAYFSAKILEKRKSAKNISKNSN